MEFTMKLDHWKNYEPIEGVTVSDRSGAWPFDREVHVLAKVGGTDVERPARVMVDGVCTLDLTTAQLAALRRALARAELDLRGAGVQAPTLAIGNEGRCESCSLPVKAGDLVHIVDDGGGERVVVHAGPCPSEEHGDG
jgi:hypothetical protein